MRPHHPWYRAATNSWYVAFNRDQHFLGKHPEGVPPPRKRKRGDPPPMPPDTIMQAYYRLMASADRRLPTAENLRVAVVCDLFLDFSQKHHAADTYRSYKDFLQDFCEMYGTLLGCDLKPLHVTRWLDAHPGWKGSRRNAIITVKRAFNWADAEGLLQPNPIKAVKKPPQRHRDRILTPEERQEILGAIRDQPFREFVLAMQESGARPGELRRVTAADVNLELGMIVLAQHKTRHKIDAPRVIYLNAVLRPLFGKLVAKYPEGPLFRGNRNHKGFTRNGIRCRFRRLREKLPHLKGVISYTYRHSFCSHGLANGVPAATMAELMGHSDLHMIQSHYNHLSKMVGHLREAADRATGG